MGKFDDELTAGEWREIAAYWRSRTARAQLACRHAYWELEAAEGMEEHCIFIAEMLEAADKKAA